MWTFQPKAMFTCVCLSKILSFCKNSLILIFMPSIMPLYVPVFITMMTYSESDSLMFGFVVGINSLTSYFWLIVTNSFFLA